MANYGKTEHKYERYTNVGLIFCVIDGILYIRFHETLLAELLVALVIITALMHLVARINHILERKQYGGRFFK